MVNYPKPTLVGTLLVIPLISLFLQNSMKRIKTSQHLRSQFYSQSLKDLLNVTSGLKESFVLGNFHDFYEKYLMSKTKLVNAKFAQDVESNYQRHLIEGIGLVILALFTVAIQFDVIPNDVSKSMLVIAFAIRLTPSFSRISSAISRANSTVAIMKKIVSEVSLKSRKQLTENNIVTEPDRSQSGIQIENLSVAIREKYLIRNLNLDLIPGDILGIEGPSGSGKTLLLETIAGLSSPQSGRIVMPERYSKSMAYLKQNPHIMDSTVEDNVKYLRDEVSDLTIQWYLEQLDIPGNPKSGSLSNPGVFSGGEKQRLALARTLAGNPKVVLLDEPTSAQDYLRRDLIMSIISSSSDAVVIVCSHSEDVLSLCNKHLNLGS